MMAGFNISPGENATSAVYGAPINFGPVNVGTTSTQDRAVNVIGVVAVVVFVAFLLRRK